MSWRFVRFAWVFLVNGMLAIVFVMPTVVSFKVPDPNANSTSRALLWLFLLIATTALMGIVFEVQQSRYAVWLNAGVQLFVCSVVLLAGLLHVVGNKKANIFVTLNALSSLIALPLIAVVVTALLYFFGRTRMAKP